MFCQNCGKEMEEGTRFCPSCGADNSLTQKITGAATDMIRSTERELGSAISDIQGSFSGAQYAGERLKTDRGIVSYIILSIITCGIYSWYFLYKMARDVNIACDGDNENTAGLIAFILLSIVTCGIYSWIWYYKLGNRLANNAPRYGLTFQENGTTVLLWLIFGVVLCGIGPLIAWNILIKNTNAICNAYNNYHNL